MLCQYLLEQLSKLRHHQVLCDLELISSDRTIFSLHQIVFVALNKRHFNLCVQNAEFGVFDVQAKKKMVLSCVDSEELKLIIDFMYGKTIDKNRYSTLQIALEKLDMTYLLDLHNESNKHSDEACQQLPCITDNTGECILPSITTSHSMSNQETLVMVTSSTSENPGKNHSCCESQCNVTTATSVQLKEVDKTVDIDLEVVEIKDEPMEIEENYGNIGQVETSGTASSTTGQDAFTHLNTDQHESDIEDITCLINNGGTGDSIAPSIATLHSQSNDNTAVTSNENSRPDNQGANSNFQNETTTAGSVKSNEVNSSADLDLHVLTVKEEPIRIAIEENYGNMSGLDTSGTGSTSGQDTLTHLQTNEIENEKQQDTASRAIKAEVEVSINNVPLSLSSECREISPEPNFTVTVNSNCKTDDSNSINSYTEVKDEPTKHNEDNLKVTTAMGVNHESTENNEEHLRQTSEGVKVEPIEEHNEEYLNEITASTPVETQTEVTSSATSETLSSEMVASGTETLPPISKSRKSGVDDVVPCSANPNTDVTQSHTESGRKCFVKRKPLFKKMVKLNSEEKQSRKVTKVTSYPPETSNSSDISGQLTGIQSIDTSPQHVKIQPAISGVNFPIPLVYYPPGVKITTSEPVNIANSEPVIIANIKPANIANSAASAPVNIAKPPNITNSGPVNIKPANITKHEPVKEKQGRGRPKLGPNRPKVGPRPIRTLQQIAKGKVPWQDPYKFIRTIANIVPLNITNSEPVKPKRGRGRPKRGSPVTGTYSQSLNIANSEPAKLKRGRGRPKQRSCVTGTANEPVKMANVESERIPKSEPVNMNRSQPVNIAQSEPENIAQGEPVIIAQSEPVNIYKPVNISQSEPENIAESESVNIAQSHAVNIDKPVNNNEGSNCTSLPTSVNNGALSSRVINPSMVISEAAASALETAAFSRKNSTLSDDNSSSLTGNENVNVSYDLESVGDECTSANEMCDFNGDETFIYSCDDENNINCVQNCNFISSGIHSSSADDTTSCTETSVSSDRIKDVTTEHSVQLTFNLKSSLDEIDKELQSLSNLVEGKRKISASLRKQRLESKGSGKPESKKTYKSLQSPIKKPMSLHAPVKKKTPLSEKTPVPMDFKITKLAKPTPLHIPIPVSKQTTDTTEMPILVKVSKQTAVSTETPMKLPVLVQKPETPMKIPVLVQKPETPMKMSVSIQKPETPMKLPVLVQKPETPMKMPVSIQKPETAMKMPVSIQKPETAMKMPVLVQKPETPMKMPVSIQKPETPMKMPVLVQKPETPMKMPVSIQKPETTEMPVSIQKPETPMKMPVSKQKPETPMKMPVSIQKPETTEMSVSIQKPETPMKMPVSIQKPETTEMPVSIQQFLHSEQTPACIRIPVPKQTQRSKEQVKKQTPISKQTQISKKTPELAKLLGQKVAPKQLQICNLSPPIPKNLIKVSHLDPLVPCNNQPGTAENSGRNKCIASPDADVVSPISKNLFKVTQLDFGVPCNHQPKKVEKSRGKKRVASQDANSTDVPRRKRKYTKRNAPNEKTATQCTKPNDLLSPTSMSTSIKPTSNLSLNSTSIIIVPSSEHNRASPKSNILGLQSLENQSSSSVTVPSSSCNSLSNFRKILPKPSQPPGTPVQVYSRLLPVNVKTHKKQED